MLPEIPDVASSGEGGDARSPLDIETLRLVHDEALSRMASFRDQRRSLYAEFAGLPPTAGAIVALFFASRSDNLAGVFSVLYGLAVVPFVLIVYMCLTASDQLDAPELMAKIAEERVPSKELLATDQLPVREWLVQSITGWRIVADVGLKYTAQYVSYVRHVRIVFGVLVVYLSAVTVVALLIG